jgi:hypothetical protein
MAVTYNLQMELRLTTGVNYLVVSTLSVNTAQDERVRDLDKSIVVGRGIL